LDPRLIWWVDEVSEFIFPYRQELPARGWTINGEDITSLGTEVSFTDPVYDGLLVFTPAEMGVLIDLALYPSGKGSIHGSEDGFVSSTELGETGGDFPADFPLPIGFEPIPVTEKLKLEGYQLVFSYPNLPEMAYIQLTSAIVAKGWEIGDFNVDPETHVYIMSFSDPASGFQGYALLTDDPGMIGMDLAGGSIIALHPGAP